jgi:hypothetical protein
MFISTIITVSGLVGLNDIRMLLPCSFLACADRAELAGRQAGTIIIIIIIINNIIIGNQTLH